MQVWISLDLAHVHPKDLLAPDLVGAVHHDLSVEAARPQKCGVKDFRPVGRGQEHDAHGRVKAVKLGQKLVQCLLFLVVAAKTGHPGPRAAKRVKLVDEDDARRRQSGLFEKVAHPRCTDTHEHLDKL